MNRPARGAGIRGDDYQAAYAWLWMMRARRPEEGITAVTVEHTDTGPFDDVVITMLPGRRDRYVQVKASVTFESALNDKWLTTGTDHSPSPLARMYTLWEQTAGLPEVERPELVVLANRKVDHVVLELAPLHGRGALPIADLRTAGPRSDVGKQLTAWRDHLGIDQERLIEFLADLLIEAGPSEDEIRRSAAAEMGRTGLRDDANAVSIGVDSVRNMVKLGRRTHTVNEINELVTVLKLHANDGHLTLAVHACDRRPTPVPPTFTVDILDRFSGDKPDDRRQLRNPAEWPAVADELGAAARTLALYNLPRVHIVGSMRLPIWFAVGAALPDVHGWTLTKDQRGQRWSTDTPAGDVAAVVIGRHPLGPDGTDLAIAVAVTHDPTDEVLGYLRNNGHGIRELLTLGTSAGLGKQSLPNAAAAMSWVLSAGPLLLRETPRPAQLHLFLACPAGVALLLGHHRNLLPPVVLYDHLLPGYAPTLRVG